MFVAKWPSDTFEIKSEIISGIGRDVEFWHLYSSYACSGCTLDPVTDTSTDSFCEICSGNYWIPIYSGDVIRAHVTWRHSEQPKRFTGGDIIDGDCQVKVMLSGNAQSIIDNVEYLVVDGRKMTVNRVTYRGATTLDRAILDLREEEKET